MNHKQTARRDSLAFRLVAVLVLLLVVVAVVVTTASASTRPVPSTSPSSSTPVRCVPLETYPGKGTLYGCSNHDLRWVPVERPRRAR